MSSRVQIILLALSSAIFASCQVYPENRPPTGPKPPQQAGNTPEQLELQKQRDEKKRLEAEKKKEEDALKGPDGSGPKVPDGGGEIKKKETGKKDYAFANPVPGKEGFVFSPYNNKMVDVRDIPSGTLVQDPTYPAADKKYFRVP